MKLVGNNLCVIVKLICDYNQNFISKILFERETERLLAK